MTDSPRPVLRKSRWNTAVLGAALTCAACSSPQEPTGDTPPATPAGERSATPATSSAAPSPKPVWDMGSSGEGVALVFPAQGDPAVRLFCPAGSGRILVNVPSFRPVGSEERLSFGSGGAVETLVADTRGDRQRGGVSGVGPAPSNLAALIAGPVAVNYGAQNSGPHSAPPHDLADAFVAACSESAPRATPSPVKVSACLVQDGKRLVNPPLRALGTEPFWGANIEGRCVTYSHPEDLDGARVWTRYSALPNGGGRWTGALEGKPFVLTTRPHPDCSDGMSDNRYPIAVDLTVAGQERRGCARRPG